MMKKIFIIAILMLTVLLPFVADSMNSLAKRVEYANSHNQFKKQLKGVAIQLQSIQTAIDNMKAVVDSDADFTQQDVDDMQQSYNFAHNSKYTECINHLSVIQ